MTMADKKIYYPIDFSFSMHRLETEKHLKKIKNEYPDRVWLIKKVDAFKDGFEKLLNKGFLVFEEITD